jgi:hypothetical protein
MPEAILTILKFCFLALLYLFLLRVIRVVYVEIGGRGRVVGGKAAKAAAPAATTARRRRGGRGGAIVLKVVAPPEVKGQAWELTDVLTVGRAAGCHLSFPDDTYISQMHARISKRDDGVFVEDLGSTNGTYLNREKVTCEMPVQRGDQIQIGKTVLELSK